MVKDWWNSLSIQTKLTLLIQGGLLVILVPTQRWIMASFEEKILAATRTQAVEAADGIINGMNMLMVTGQIGDPKNRALFISKMSNSSGVRDLRIFRAEQVKRQFGPGLPEEQPQDDIDRKVLETGKPYFERTSRSGVPMLRAVIPFLVSRNFRGTDCLMCHKVEVGSVNGAASILLDLTEQTHTIASFDLWLWFGQLGLQFILFIVVRLILQSVTAPLGRLQEIMTAMQVDGDLSRRVTVTGGDEIGRMGRAFNALADSLQKSIEEVHAGQEKLKLTEQVFVNSMEAIVITDADNRIIQVNKAFTEITGYAPPEVLGRNPNVLKSGHHPPEFYRAMWDILLTTGSWQGEVMDRRKNGEIYPKWLAISVLRNAHGKVTNYVGSFTDISERKLSEEKILRLAYHDSLTNLPNRLNLYERLKMAINLARRNDQQMAVMLLDLDRFKSINDTLGHNVGDELLVEVASRLAGAVRQTDLVSRLGGDEFVVVLTAIDSPSDAAEVAGKIINTVSAPYVVNGHDLRTSTSIGICVYPIDATEISDLIRNADVAMYHAKDMGRGNFQFFTGEMNQSAMRRQAIEAALRTALQNEQFVLYYQPQLDLRSGRLTGVEALIRWQHPERGMVSPADFIPVAEETGLITPIGRWALREACRQMKAWQDAGINGITVSVNLSAVEFQDKDLLDSVKAILAETGLPPGSLDLEVTETMAMASPNDAIATMRKLSEIGVTLSIDDFGTGYSSMSYLKIFPIHHLKIDRSFVKDIEVDANDADICDVTVLLAHKLGLSVVAEGVETAEQLKFLLSIGCDIIQGYLLSKPLSAEMAKTFLLGHRPMTELGTVDLWEKIGPEEV
jgi:diguanylate cyclase (GGDEF)-like protein/PAS domain S-box-containing protein